MPKIRDSWLRTLLFIQESYLALTALVLLALAFGRIDTDGPTMGYMFLGYLAVIITLFISGIILIVFGKRKPGLIALGFAVGAFLLLLVILPALAATKRRA